MLSSNLLVTFERLKKALCYIINHIWRFRSCRDPHAQWPACKEPHDLRPCTIHVALTYKVWNAHLVAKQHSNLSTIVSSMLNLQFLLGFMIPNPNKPNEQLRILHLNDEPFDSIVDSCSLWCQPRPILGFQLRFPVEYYTPSASLRVFASAQIRDQDVWDAAICEVRKDSDAFRVHPLLDIDVILGPYPRSKLKEETLQHFGFTSLDESEWERRCCAWVLPLAMQRFKDCHWDLHPNIDPKFATMTPSYTTTLPGEEGKEIGITLKLSSEERSTHFGLATSVFPAMSKAVPIEDGLVAKVFWVEETRTSEPDILKRWCELAEGNNDANRHVPDMVSYKSYLLTSTSVIQKRLGPKTDGSRVRYSIIFRLKPITELVGDEFLHAWLETVMCHLALWKHDVHHRDISPSNLMYWIVNGKIMGVLNDFDLASIGDGVTGTERTGTVPFMAIDLLRPEAGSGQISHLYEHDAESFIWVLVWVALRYENGKLREQNRSFEKWLTGDANTCYEEKSAFQCDPARWDLVPGAGHERNLDVANMCLNALLAQALAQNMPKARRRVLDIDTAFQQLIAGPLEPFLNPTN